jgi:hypothetical protein
VRQLSSAPCSLSTMERHTPSSNLEVRAWPPHPMKKLRARFSKSSLLVTNENHPQFLPTGVRCRQWLNELRTSIPNANGKVHFEPRNSLMLGARERSHVYWLQWTRTRHNRPVNAYMGPSPGCWKMYYALQDWKSFITGVLQSH